MSQNDQHSRGIFFLLISMVWLLGTAAWSQTPANTTKVYCVVVSEKTYADKDWHSVADALVAKHHGRLIRYDSDLRDALPALQTWLPDYIGFVAKPEEANRAFVIQVHRITRELDSDPYTDAIWGIITGYEAADALRIVKQSSPLRIHRGMSSMGAGLLGQMESGFASAETGVGELWRKASGKTEKTTSSPDVAEALAQAFNEIPIDYMITSGHATERDWQIGYNIPNGQIRSEHGQLFTLDTKNKRHPFHSDNPKIYLAAGNCLIGHVPDREALALAWMHSGGVAQMVGYTVVTFFGYGGWGTGQYFDRGEHTLAESFFFNSQSLLRQLQTKFPAGLNINLPPQFYEPQYINQLFSGHMTQEQAGMVWDRDTVAFYGDPAWDVRWPHSNVSWKQPVEFRNGKGKFIIETTKDGGWPDRPVAALLPERLQNITVTKGTNYNPVITDNFILVPLTGEYKAGQRIEIEFTGEPLARPNPDALAKLRLMESAKGERRQAFAFLLANMPSVDRERVTAVQLDETVTLALRAREQAPWGNTVPMEIFLNNVLPYANLDEARDPWRKDFFTRFAHRAWKEKTPADAAQMLNREIFKELKVSYHATKRPRPNQSPKESIEAGYASCTGLSILLVDACRACGIPARIAGIPAWPSKDADERQNAGNHTWVEIWSENQWHYVGAAEPDKLDHAWFSDTARNLAWQPNKPQHHILAASFRRTDIPYLLPWSPTTRWISAEDVSDRYIASHPKFCGQQKSDP